MRPCLLHQRKFPQGYTQVSREHWNQLPLQKTTAKKNILLLMAEILHQLRLVVFPIVFRGSYIPGGCLGFQPSTVLVTLTEIQQQQKIKARPEIPNSSEWSKPMNFMCFCFLKLYEIIKGTMVVNSPLIRPAISWGGGIGGAPLDSHDDVSKCFNISW